MRNTVRQVFQTGRFVIGFIILSAIVLGSLIYPILNPTSPLEIIGEGTFFPPGIYVNAYDSLSSQPYKLQLTNASANRIDAKLNPDDRIAIKDYLVAVGIPATDIDTADTAKLLTQWKDNYDPKKQIKGITNAKRNYYVRLNKSLAGLLSTSGAIIATKDPETGELTETSTLPQTTFVNVAQVPNVRVLLLGTDNFGRDVLTELASATRVSLLIGLLAGLIATLIGLALGLLAGYIGGVVDDVIMFITNIFTVIPSFVLLILISYSIGQESRGIVTVGIVIGFTSWVWTTRAVRAQVISLRSRDHVNLSKLSGHSTLHIILSDILPYIASYVVMALILQISSGILAEAGLSILGLGPKTTETPTLGLMMHWARIYQADIQGRWWAYLPVLVTIAMTAFSMQLMNTGLDRVFNPTLRD